MVIGIAFGFLSPAPHLDVDTELNQPFPATRKYRPPIGSSSMSKYSKIEIPEAFFHLCKGLNGDTIAHGIEGMARQAVKNYLKPEERSVCRSFVADVLNRIEDDDKLQWPLQNCKSELSISQSSGARIALEAALKALDESLTSN